MVVARTADRTVGGRGERRAGGTRGQRAHPSRAGSRWTNALPRQSKQTRGDSAALECRGGSKSRVRKDGPRNGVINVPGESKERRRFWTEANWFAVQAKPHRENLAAASISNLEIEVFLPRIKQEQLVCG